MVNFQQAVEKCVENRGQKLVVRDQRLAVRKQAALLFGNAGNLKERTDRYERSSYGYV